MDAATSRFCAEMAEEMAVKIRTYLRGDMELDAVVLTEWLGRYTAGKTGTHVAPADQRSNKEK